MFISWSLKRDAGFFFFFSNFLKTYPYSSKNKLLHSLSEPVFWLDSLGISLFFYLMQGSGKMGPYEHHAELATDLTVSHCQGRKED